VNALIKDWTKFCTGKENFDKSHFATLFSQDLDDEKLKEIFSFFPSMQSMVERLKKLKSAGSLERGPYFLPKTVAMPKDLIELVKLDVKNQLLLCGELGNEELCEKIMHAKVEFVDDKHAIEKFRNQNSLSEQVFELIGDYIGEVSVTDTRIDALEEALYGLAANYYLAWYIMAPVLKLSIDFESYFNVWRNGGIYVIVEGHILISSIKL
jgi:hypothetical protein